MNKLDPIFIKILIVFFILGAFVSIFACLISGVDILTLILRPILYGLIMAFLGGGLYFLLKSMSPEIIEVLQKDNVSGDSNGTNLEGDGNLAAGTEITDELSTPFDSGEDVESKIARKNANSSDEMFKSKRSSSITNIKRTHAKEGEILVEGVPIKNEPELMARTIKDLITRDTDD